MSRPPIHRGVLLVTALAALVVGAIAVGLMAARGPDPDAVPSAQQVYDRTMSPYCPGLTLSACPSNQAVELRGTIATMVGEGRTNRQIEGFLLATFPKTVLGAPRNPLAWLVPAALVLCGLAGVVAVMLRRPRPGAGVGPEEQVPPISASDSARLAADLRRFAEGVSE